MTDTQHDTAGVLAPPPLLYAGFFLAGIGLDRLWPIEMLRRADPEWRYATATVLFVIGAAVAVPALRGFRAAGTSIPPHRPTTALVTSGPYRFSRNPIYIGVSLAYVALAVALASTWALILLPPLLAVLHYGVIAREEAYLERKFGPEYRRYRQAVRRWL